MTITTLGSINIDHVYRLAAFPRPGETLTCRAYERGLGGKGANQSLAAAAAGAKVAHVGAVGADGAWTVEALSEGGVDTSGIATSIEATGHAIIYVDDLAENQIVIHGGANRALQEQDVFAAIERAEPGSWLLMQNETNLVAEAATKARARGLKVAYAAAPFDRDAVIEMLDRIDLLAVNTLEAEAVARLTGSTPDAIPVPEVLMTRGGDGAVHYGAGGSATEITAFPVEPVDTTGAGDTFLGYFLAARSMGDEIGEALRLASGAAAVQVTRPGAAAAIPSRADVMRFLEDHR